MEKSPEEAPTSQPIKGQSSQELYFSKDGRTLYGCKAPSAFALHYPWPPSPTNLGKNRVFRPQEEETEKVVNQVVEEFEKELGITTKDSEGKSKAVSVNMVPEIELAIYWDRHPFRPVEKSLTNMNRAKSAMNLSQVADLLTPDRALLQNGNKSKEIVEKVERSSSAVSSQSSRTTGQSQNSSKGSRRSSVANNNTEQLETSSRSNVNPRVPKILQVLSKNEKRECSDSEVYKRQSNNSPYGHYNPSSPPKLVRDVINHHSQKSIGVQVTLDGVGKAAMKSTYLCPLHGQYRKGVERRSKSGFRTDLSATTANPHAHCSRASRSRSRPRTKLVKCTGMQTDEIDANTNEGTKNRRNRSKTAPPLKRATNVNMISEQSASFRHPGHIRDAENRKLRNKILSYCFTKHSIF